MPNINFNCPSCETKDKITLMGESHGVFEKKCKECGITIELTVEDNELKEAERIDQILQPVHKSLFIESNPAPVKYAAKLLGLCDDEIRLPLVKIKKETQEKIKKALSSAKLIS